MARQPRWTILQLMGVVLACAVVFALSRGIGIIVLLAYILYIMPTAMVRWQQARRRSSALPAAAGASIAFFLFVLVGRLEYLYRRWDASGRRGPLNLTPDFTDRELLPFVVMGVAFAVSMGVVAWRSDKSLKSRLAKEQAKSVRKDQSEARD